MERAGAAEGEREPQKRRLKMSSRVAPGFPTDRSLEKEEWVIPGWGWGCPVKYTSMVRARWAGSPARRGCRVRTGKCGQETEGKVGGGSDFRVRGLALGSVTAAASRRTGSRASLPLRAVSCCPDWSLSAAPPLCSHCTLLWTTRPHPTPLSAVWLLGVNRAGTLLHLS